MSEETTLSSKQKTVKSIWTIIRYILAAAAGVAIGVGAEKAGITDKEAVEDVKTVVTKTIKGEEVTEAEKKAAQEGASVVVKKVVDKKLSEAKESK